MNCNEFFLLGNFWPLKGPRESMSLMTGVFKAGFTESWKHIAYEEQFEYQSSYLLSEKSSWQ